MLSRESTTLKFVIISYAIITIKYLVSGMTLPVVGLMPVTGMTEYAGSVAAILTIWLAREWRKTHYESKSQ